MNGNYRDDVFKVIIVGAGVGGLTLAHALHKAGIDYVVLDKHPVAPAWGASITIHPSASRILHQIRCLDQVHSRCEPMTSFSNRGPDGKEFMEFLQILYDALPDKTKVLDNARVVDVIEEKGVVRAILADGTVHEGDVIVAFDGVHSAVRALMWDKAANQSPGLFTVQEKQSIKTSYNCLLGVAPPQPSLGRARMTNVSNDKFSFLFLSQPDALSFIVHCKLPGGRVITWPDRAHYTAADAEAKAAELSTYPVSDEIVFGDIWRSRIRGHLVSLEEGILSRWFHGRTVLAGDSAHKVTPNAAFGGFLAMEDAVVLANELYAAVARHPNKKPSDTELRTVLHRYQEERVKRAKEIMVPSWLVTRLQAYDGWPFYIIQRWILPIVGLGVIGNGVADSCSTAPKLDYVPLPDEKKGTLPWKYRRRETAKGTQVAEKKPATKGYDSLIVPVVLSTMALYFVTMTSKNTVPSCHCD
ncbi:FAD binding domain-containing protein [Colletotrichum zoysiae]|uniref:FAD binding domain-containing protein n=1 Tax=Colletotrichum zoysiae TaxID=1216348 RepID=A0AAD9H9H3_9PEZI|nr:FAD binding domain-containing protein [Colletotrichum zoysiae]